MMSLLEASAHTPPVHCCLPVHSFLEQDAFATVPTYVISPARVAQSKDEEDVYTSFEEAIRERAARISRYLSSQPAAAQDHLAGATPTISARLSGYFWAGRRAITMACLALSLLLAGFDLMGLLIILR
jgi:hypothetical protein